MNGNVIPFPGHLRSWNSEDARPAAERALALEPEERLAKANDLGLEHPELLLAVCELLRRRMETEPAVVRREAEFFFRFLWSPSRDIGQLDERDYFLGELALAAGTASRITFRREEAAHWFDRAEANFVLVQNSSAHIARLAYQRLALHLEERKIEEVLEFAPLWARTLGRLGLAEESLKCEFLQALALREIGRVEDGIKVLLSIGERADRLGTRKLLAHAFNNLAQFYRVAGDQARALESAQKALPLLQQLDNRMALAKLRWCVGDILRDQRKVPEAIDAYREALKVSEEIGLRGDVAAIHLVVADLLLDSGLQAQAEWEIRAALPIIEEEHMVPEGLAAFTLLRESLRRREVNHQALRDLHGYFREPAS